MRFFREIHRFLTDARGAVSMEYVLLCVLLAAASVVMVIAFSRAVARQFAMVSYAMSGYAQEQIEEGVKQFRQAGKDDAVVADVYSDYMHGEKVNKQGN